MILFAALAVLATFGCFAYLLFRVPSVNLYIRLRWTAREIRKTILKIAKLEAMIVHISSEAFANRLRINGWWEPFMSDDLHIMPKNDKEIEERQQIVITWQQNEITALHMKLEGLRGTWDSLVKQHRSAREPESLESMRRRLGEKQRQAALLISDLAEKEKQIKKLETEITSAEGDSNYREQKILPRMRIADDFEEVDEMVEKELKKRKRESA
jgi:chromosome segregation ATPase